MNLGALAAPGAIFHPHFSAQPMRANALHFAFVGDQLLLDEAGQLPTSLRLSSLAPADSRFSIGLLGDEACLALGWPGGTTLPAGLRALGLRDAWNLLPEALYQVAARARQLLIWDQQSRFCGACGHATAVDAKEPAKRCPACGLVSYPRLSPAIMVLIHRGDELLLARSPHFKPGVYSALAGFVEAGESAEQCLHREVKEEVGLEVCNLRWFASQSWPFPHSLMLAFHADYAAGEIVPQVGEIEDARWFRRDALPLLPNPVSVAWHLIQDGLR